MSTEAQQVTQNGDGDETDDWTNIRVSGRTADELHDMKKRGDSYEDVVRRLLDAWNEDDDS